MVKGLGSVGWRSFLVQAAKNYRTMLGMGYAFSELPLIRDKAGDDGEEVRTESCAFFNTQPYFIPLTIGMTERARQQGLPSEQIRNIKKTVMGPFGALGDAFFWATVKPTAAVMGILFATLINPLWGIIILLLIFNLFHLPLRLSGAYLGYNLFTKAPALLEKLHPYRIKAVLEIITGLGLGCLLALVAWHSPVGSASPYPACGLLVGLVVGIGGSLVKLPLWVSWLAAAALMILLGYLVV